MPERDRAKPVLTAARDPVAPPGDGSPAKPAKRPLIASRRPAAPAPADDGKTANQQTSRKRRPLTAAREDTERPADAGLRRRAGGMLASLVVHGGLAAYLLFAVGSSQQAAQPAGPPTFDLAMLRPELTSSVFGSPEMVEDAVPETVAAAAPADTLAEAAVEPDVAEPPAPEAAVEPIAGEAPPAATAEAEVLAAATPEAAEQTVAAEAPDAAAPAPAAIEPPSLAPANPPELTVGAVEPVEAVPDATPVPPTAEPSTVDLAQPVATAEAVPPPAPDVSTPTAVDPVPLPVPSETVTGVLPPALTETPELPPPLTGEPPPPAPDAAAPTEIADVLAPSGETAPPPPPELPEVVPPLNGEPPPDIQAITQIADAAAPPGETAPPPLAPDTANPEAAAPTAIDPLAEVEAPATVAPDAPLPIGDAGVPPLTPVLEAAASPTVITDAALPVPDPIVTAATDTVIVSDPAAPPDILVSDPLQVASLPPTELLPVHDPMEEMASELAQALEGVPCARLAAHVDAGTGVLELSGHLRDRTDLQDLVSRLGDMPGVDWVDDSRLQMVGEPLCVVVEQVLGPLLRRQSPAPDSLGEAVQSANLAAAPGDQVALTIGGVDFRAFIQVDWYESGDRVVHLMQGTDFGIDGWPANQSLTLAPGRLGLPLTADGPERETLVTAIVTSQPLFAERRPMVEPLSVYVDDLRVRLAEVAVPNFGIQVEITYALLRISPPRELPATD
ncbi:MAG: hypothetical protein KDA64_08185 [Rhodospirillaceae bacterium]|nr:hypothetical protein [Rhodospirillaceae bacterium]